MSLPLRLFSPFSRLVTRSVRRAVEDGRLIQRTAPLPVVSVGNIAFGGSGKTPLAIAIMEDLHRAGRRPAFVSRGYRGAWEEKGGVIADGRRILATWRQAGDEPYMVARALPGAGVFVGRNRLASCVRARDAGFDVAVLDDAFQHLRLARPIDVVLHDPGARRPLRESPSALRRAGAVLVPRSGDAAAKSRLEARLGGVPVFEYDVKPLGLIEAARPSGPGPAPRTLIELREPGGPAAAWPLGGRAVVAVCGIARPKRFFATLESCGLAPAARLAFPDHHAYPPASRARVVRAAAAAASGGAVIVTTEKDLAKLEDAPELAPFPLYALRIRLDVSPALFDLIRRALGII